ncbi:MAG: TlpA family protein disulfide reductase [Deltaproteobacteria bacterium]|nr:TlpA family protein disulfide reductase [Deltaproteobacteria bacterium]MBW2417353.1 TlpA family protein disulfide reductase [Deltaproteobacteria bacterium]
MRGTSTRVQLNPIHLAAVLLGALLLAVPPAAAIGEGKPAPTFALPSLSGDETLSLSDFRGKVVYLDFWASWCAPCVSAMPFLEELRTEFPSSRFQVLAINLDKDPRKGEKFMRKYGVKYPSASDPKGRLPQSFGLQTMPTSYLIDGNGVVRYVHKGFRGGDVQAIRDEIAKLVGGRK